jgi:hypothetical protein
VTFSPNRMGRISDNCRHAPQDQHIARLRGNEAGAIFQISIRMLPLSSPPLRMAIISYLSQTKFQYLR